VEPIMNDEQDRQPSTWTWADQVSSWRFWALLLAYALLVSLADAALFQSFPFWREIAGLGPAEYGSMFTAHHIATAFGLCLAWVAVRWRPGVSLVLLAVLKVCGLVLLFFTSVGSFGTRFTGSVLIGLSTGALALAVPALIAGGRRGAEAFVVSFGVVTTFGVVVGVFANMAIGASVRAWGPWWVAYIAAIAAVVGTLVVATAGPALFAGPPPARGYALTPAARGPVVAALLTLVPFYGLYWLYRSHGEVASVAPSRNLLSPRAALWGSLFVPFLAFVAMASLVDALNARCSALGRPRVRSPVAVFLWSLFFAPVAVGLVQAGINRLLAGTAKPQSAGA
jgi:hypothetical protein